MEHKRGNEAYVILHRGARSRGYKRRERARVRARERESLRASVSPCLVCPARRVSTCASLYVNINVCLPARTSVRKALDIPFYRCKEMAQLYNGVAMC
jgi:hypothetical protein